VFLTGFGQRVKWYCLSFAVVIRRWSVRLKLGKKLGRDRIKRILVPIGQEIAFLLALYIIVVFPLGFEAPIAR